jgi:prophage regulatory protein
LRAEPAQLRGFRMVGLYRFTMLTNTPVNNESPHRLLRMPAVCAASGQARSTIYRRIEEGLWPKPVKLGPRAVAWPASEVAAVNAARVAGRTDDDVRALVSRLTEARKIMGVGL